MSHSPEPLPARDAVRLFRTLSDETRLRLLRLLSREELTVNELAEITQLAQPRISNHLKILREENLVSERREGSWRHYRVQREDWSAAAQALWPSLEAAWADDPSFSADDQRLVEVLAGRMLTGRQDFFDRLAERWDEVRASLFGDALGRAILRALLPPDLVVADVGTGTGYVLQLFGAHARRLIAVDRSEAMLAVARQKASAAGLTNIEFRAVDANQSPLQPGEADVVTVIQVMQHLEDPGGTLAKVAVGIKPGGVLVLSDFLPHDEAWLRRELQHRWNGFAQAKVQGWLADAGLAVTHWEVLAGRSYTTPEGEKIRIPDGFLCLSRKMQK